MTRGGLGASNRLEGRPCPAGVPAERAAASTVRAFSKVATRCTPWHRLPCDRPCACGLSPLVKTLGWEHGFNRCYSTAHIWLWLSSEVVMRRPGPDSHLFPLLDDAPDREGLGLLLPVPHLIGHGENGGRPGSRRLTPCRPRPCRPQRPRPGGKAQHPRAFPCIPQNMVVHSKSTRANGR